MQAKAPGQLLFDTFSRSIFFLSAKLSYGKWHIYFSVIPHGDGVKAGGKTCRLYRLLLHHMEEDVKRGRNGWGLDHGELLDIPEGFWFLGSEPSILLRAGGARLPLRGPKTESRLRVFSSSLKERRLLGCPAQTTKWRE